MLSTIRETQFVAFVGAGASAAPPACLPTWTGFNDLLLECLCERLGAYSENRQPVAIMLETFRRIRNDGRFFAPDFQAQLIEEEVGAAYFRVWQSIDSKIFGPVHAGLAEIAADRRLSAIITTNFDRLLETALAAIGVPFEVLHDEASFSRFLTSRPVALPVLKIHGSIEDLSSLIDTLKQRVVGRPQPLMDAVRRLLIDFPWLYVGFSGADFSYDPHYLGILDAADNARGFVFLARSGSKLNRGILDLQKAYGPHKAEILEGDLNTWLHQTFNLPSFQNAAASGAPAVKRRIGEWVAELGDISVINIVYSMLRSAGLGPSALWLMRKTFRTYRSTEDTAQASYHRFNFNYGLSLLDRGFIRNPLALKDDFSNLPEWKRHADQNAFEFLARAYKDGGLLPAGAALAALMALRGQVGHAVQLASEVTDTALSKAATADLCDVALSSATIYDIAHIYYPAVIQLRRCLERVKRLGDEPRRAMLCVELARSLANAKQQKEAEGSLAEGASIANRLGLQSVSLAAEAARGLTLIENDPSAAVEQLKAVRDRLYTEDEIPLYTRVNLNETDPKPLPVLGRSPLLCRVLLDLATAGMLATDADAVSQTLDELDELTTGWFLGYCPQYYLTYAEALIVSEQPEAMPTILDLLSRARDLGNKSGNPWVEQAAGLLEQRV